MNSGELGKIAYRINVDLVNQGLNDAEISFIGTCLLSYSIAQTTMRILEAKSKDGLVREP